MMKKTKPRARSRATLGTPMAVGGNLHCDLPVSVVVGTLPSLDHNKNNSAYNNNNNKNNISNSYAAIRGRPPPLRSRSLLKNNSGSSLLIVITLIVGMLLSMCFMLLGAWYVISLKDKEHNGQPLRGASSFSCSLIFFCDSNSNNNNNKKVEKAREDYKSDESNSNPYGFEATTKMAPLCSPLTSIDSITYTLVTQLSTSRLFMMEHVCQRWGPHAMSIAILVDSSPSKFTQNYFYQKLKDMKCPVSDMAISILVSNNSSNDRNMTDNSTSMNDTNHNSKDHYPVNQLRNLALCHVKTTHVVYLDIDFWPAHNLYETLHRPAVLRHWMQNDDGGVKSALIIPAFQIPRQCREYRDCRRENIAGMPKTRLDLRQRYKDGQAFMFDHSNPGGHGSTLYHEWMKDKFGYRKPELLQIPCIQSNRYEPYPVFRYCRDAPPFQEAFTGYGKNKMTWFMQLRRMGWQFWQVQAAYCVHYPHLDSPTRKEWNGGKDGRPMHRPNDDDLMKEGGNKYLTYQRGQNDLKYLEFKRWLYREIPNQAVTPLCLDNTRKHQHHRQSNYNGSQDDDAKLWVPRDIIREYHRDYFEHGEELGKVEKDNQQKGLVLASQKSKRRKQPQDHDNENDDYTIR